MKASGRRHVTNFFSPRVSRHCLTGQDVAHLSPELLKRPIDDSSVWQTQAADYAAQPGHLRNPAEYQTARPGPVFVED